MKTPHRCNRWMVIAITLIALASGCQPPSQPPPAATTSQPPTPSRLDSIPAAAVKMTPSLDIYPPVMHSTEFEAPVPLAGPVNTAGAEDSPFIPADGGKLYTFFTPDASQPPEKQLFDGVTGIWVSDYQNGAWTDPKRIVLQAPGKLSLDGAEFILGNTMWFASAREGNNRDIDLWIAELAGGVWTNWKNAGALINVTYDVGEMHITADGNTLYYHSAKSGGLGGLDIWVSHFSNGAWQSPQNVIAINSETDDGWPYVTPDGKELWFTRTYLGAPAIFRSKLVNGQWSEPELMVSRFAGEPTMDATGNLYFTHHFIKDGKIIEADIYVAYRKG